MVPRKNIILFPEGLTLHKGLCYIANEEKLLRVQIHGSKSRRAVDIPR